MYAINYDHLSSVSHDLLFPQLLCNFLPNLLINALCTTSWSPHREFEGSILKFQFQFQFRNLKSFNFVTYFFRLRQIVQEQLFKTCCKIFFWKIVSFKNFFFRIELYLLLFYFWIFQTKKIILYIGPKRKSMQLLMCEKELCKTMTWYQYRIAFHAQQLCMTQETVKHLLGKRE